RCASGSVPRRGPPRSGSAGGRRELGGSSTRSAIVPCSLRASSPGERWLRRAILVLPNFLMIGSMKAGTTSLYEYLRTHPQVFMSERKELDYFTTGIDRGLDRDWYEGCFERADGARAVGEASTGYTKFPTHRDVAARVAALLPDVRLIYMIRNPIERMRSQW